MMESSRFRLAGGDGELARDRLPEFSTLRPTTATEEASISVESADCEEEALLELGLVVKCQLLVWLQKFFMTAVSSTLEELRLRSAWDASSSSRRFTSKSTTADACWFKRFCSSAVKPLSRG